LDKDRVNSCHLQVKLGLRACQWTSCSEGCTRDLYKCYQVRVSYGEIGNGGEVEGTLFVNPSGCGYPPDVSCDGFFEEFGRRNASHGTFPCHYSRRNGSVVVPTYNGEREKSTLAYSAVPFAVTVFSVAVVVVVNKAQSWKERCCSRRFGEGMGEFFSFLGSIEIFFQASSYSHKRTSSHHQQALSDDGTGSCGGTLLGGTSCD
jgi:hypothetical protein